MSQQIINISNSVSTGTGDELRVAFSKSNDNFTELYSHVPPDAISYQTNNVVLALGNSTSTFENNLEITQNLMVDEDLIVIGSISAIADGGTY